MYSKQEDAQIRKQFWTSFGQYLAPIPSAEGMKINWINYKTGIRFVNFKMDASRDQAYIGIELSHSDIVTQGLFFNHLHTLREELEHGGSGKWIWEKAAVADGKTISRIYQVLQPVSIYKQADWPQVISFLKTRLVSLDLFWIHHKEIFQVLA